MTITKLENEKEKKGKGKENQTNQKPKNEKLCLQDKYTRRAFTQDFQYKNTQCWELFDAQPIVDIIVIRLFAWFVV